MPKFEPQITIGDLQGVVPGSLVIFENQIAFAGINPSAPAHIVTLAAHDPQQHKFVYRYFDGAQPQILAPGGELIIKPSLKTFTANLTIEPATTNLFFKDGESFIVVHIPTTPDVRLLSLNSGSLLSPRFSQMDAFTSWEAGVTSSGEFLPLFQV